MGTCHIGVILLLNDERGHGDIDHLPLYSFEAQLLVGVLFDYLLVFVRTASGLEFELDFRVEALEFQSVQVSARSGYAFYFLLS